MRVAVAVRAALLLGMWAAVEAGEREEGLQRSCLGTGSR